MKYLINKIDKKYKELSITKKAIIWFTFATVIQKAISFLVTPFYTRILTENEYGIYSVFQSWQQILSVIVILALDRCVTVGFMKFEKNRKEFLASVQLLMTLLIIIFGIIIFIFSDYITSLMNLPIYIIYAMLIIILLNNSLANWSWFQRYNYKYVKLAIVTIISTIIIQVCATLSIIFIPSNNKGISMIIGMTIGTIILYGMIYFSVYHNAKKIINIDYWKFALKYSTAIIPHALSQIILNSSDRIMIDKFCSRADAAYYGVTYSAAMVLNILMSSISSAVQPWYYEKIKIKDFDSIKKNSNLLLLISAFLSICVSFIAPEILNIMAPESYGKALLIFPAIAASIFFNSMYLYFANFESYYEKPAYFSVATTIGAVTNIVLNYIFIPIWGFAVAGYTTLICYMLFAFMHYIFMRKICKKELNNVKPFDSKFIVILSIIVLLITIGVTYLYDYIFIRYVVILIGLIYCIIKRKKINTIIKNFYKK